MFIISCSLSKQLLCLVYCEFINYHVTSWWCGLRSAILRFHKINANYYSCCNKRTCTVKYQTMHHIVTILITSDY